MTLEGWTARAPAKGQCKLRAQGRDLMGDMVGETIPAHTVGFEALVAHQERRKYRSVEIRAREKRLG